MRPERNEVIPKPSEKRHKSEANVRPRCGERETRERKGVIRTETSETRERRR